MKKTTSPARLFAVASLAGLLASSASAVTITYAPVLVNLAQTTSSTDLANSNQASFGSWTILQGGIASNGNTPSTTPNVLSDGSYGYFDGNANDYNFSGTFRPTTVSWPGPDNFSTTTVLLLTLTAGFDLSSITTVSGSFDAGFYATRQNYQISVAQVGSNTFTTLVTGLNLSEDNNAAQEERYRSVSVTSTFTASEALNIDRVKFTFLAGPGDVGKLYREVDVFGTAAIPEPSSYAALVGLIGLGFAAARRRARR
jgi:hypothetical protein